MNENLGPDRSLTIGANQHGAAMVFLLAGVLDGGTSTDLAVALVKAAAESKIPRLVLDFSGVTLVSSAGWAVVLRNTNHVRERGGNLRLTGLNGSVEQSFRLLGLHSHLSTFPDPHVAVRHPW